MAAFRCLCALSALGLAAATDSASSQDVSALMQAHVRQHSAEDTIGTADESPLAWVALARQKLGLPQAPAPEQPASAQEFSKLLAEQFGVKAADSKVDAQDHEGWTNLVQGQLALLRTKLGEDTLPKSNGTQALLTKKGYRDLFFIHIPCNFGHSVEMAALGDTAGLAGLAQVAASFHAPTLQQQWAMVQGVTAYGGGEAWGMLNPDLRHVEHTTGCDMYYAPPKYWPQALKQKYKGHSFFGILRDPYDKLVNEFRMNLLDISSGFNFQTRGDVSKREGNMEKEGTLYKHLYETCDVNAWLKLELKQFKEGDHFRGNCHMLPQAEYFEGGMYGITQPIDNRLIPPAFDKEMQGHGYANIHMRTPIHNTKCNGVTARSLDADVKKLIREVYKKDFELVCKKFGHCNDKEMTCIKAIPQMCGH